ncbi:hypothetical protein, partial [Flavobacterium sp.]|uniref:hypothetical protein n=1 Tax=Flavobacterium sp. TaxID=239 RepID=UPI0037BF1ADB
NSNKFTDTNNCGVNVFFPCMSKFKKNQIYLQGFVYLSCATCTNVWRKCEFLVNSGSRFARYIIINRK